MNNSTLDKQIEEYKKEMQKYAPKPNGCDNCWGDLGGKCTDKCKEEFKVYGEYWETVNNFVSQLKTLILKTCEEELKALKKEYEEVQDYLDKEYGEGVHCPNYMGILETKIEELITE